MKKLTFKVSSQKDCSVVSLIKEVNKISCRIYLDIENGFVTVENVNDTMIDTVIELVDNYYTILGVDIDNTFEETTTQATPVVTETVEESARTEIVAEKYPTVVGPQSEDDLIIQKVEFENEYVEGLINKLLRTVSWAMFKMDIPEREIGDFIYTSINEISMRYNNKNSIEFSVGDIVDCNYGTHLNGEINGAHIASIVCNIAPSGMVYLVPITKSQTDTTIKSHIVFNAPEDVIYTNDYYRGGTAMLEKSRYVRSERINEVIGKTTPAFFESLLKQLSSTFDFTKFLTETVDNDDDLPFTMGETTGEVVDTFVATEETADEVVDTSVATEETTDEVVDTSVVTEETADEVVDTSVVSEETADEVVNPKVTVKKAGGEETALLEVIGFAFDKLDASKKVEDQIDGFLTDIGMTTTERMVTQSFVVACDIKKINYENVILGLHEEFPKVKEEIIKSILKEAFKNWLENYPTLAEKCPKISLMAILKVFAKRFA